MGLPMAEASAALEALLLSRDHVLEEGQPHACSSAVLFVAEAALGVPPHSNVYAYGCIITEWVSMGYDAT